MPRRKCVLATSEVYHVFNRAIDGKPIFDSKRDLHRAFEILWYYQFTHPAIPFSKYLNLRPESKVSYHNHLVETHKTAQVLAYCLMTNHFHLLLRQTVDNGISRYLANFQNSYTRFFNQKYERRGALFMNQFKAVHIETDEQLMHTSRYIHLNPVTGYLLKTVRELPSYPWSSFNEYLGLQNSYLLLSEPKEVLGLFGSRQDYQKFVYDQADYQRQLDKIKHLTIEKS